ncbi:MAG: plasmid pRiA4b ORF-3 family protein [Clostridiales bacterium]|nr:plasmid pRiA4b ORF-3 family protein [Clostridiales bacterium]
MSWRAGAADIEAAVTSFKALCDYISERKPEPTKSDFLKNRDCLELNRQIKPPFLNAKPSYSMRYYTSMLVLFEAALASGIIVHKYRNGRSYFDASLKYSDFLQLNIFSQYFLIFQTWFAKTDMKLALDEKSAEPFKLVDETLEHMRKNAPGGFIAKDKALNEHGYYTGAGEPVENGSIIFYAKENQAFRIFETFGLVETDDGGDPKFYYRIHPTPFGRSLAESLKDAKCSIVNVFSPNFDASLEESYIEGKAELIPIISCFPEGALDLQAISNITGKGRKMPSEQAYDMVVRYTKTRYRIIRCHGGHTFEELHFAIQSAFGLDSNHLYKFTTADASIYSPLCDEDIKADKAKLCDAIFYENQHIAYLFDFEDNWLFDLEAQFLTDFSEEVTKPFLIKSVGADIDQYPEYDW